MTYFPPKKHIEKERENVLLIMESLSKHENKFPLHGFDSDFDVRVFSTKGFLTAKDLDADTSFIRSLSS